MMGAEKTLVNVNKGQDPYSVIGNYILNHVTVIEDIIAVIQINGVIINELYMADVDDDGYFYWKGDWWEGEEDVALLDFFPVSDAERIKWIPCSERMPEDGKWCLFTDGVNMSVERYKEDALDHFFPAGRWFSLEDAIAWMPLPEPYREGGLLQ